VPQGSILGPVLFILFLNDIFGCIDDESTLTLYADHASLVVSASTSENLKLKAENNLADITSWFNSNQLLVNANKTKFLRFHNVHHNLNLDINLKINNETVSRENFVKFLGIIVDHNLNFKSHCNSVVKKMNSQCYLIRNLKYVLTQNQIVMYYKSNVESVLRYGICFWGYSTDSQIVFKTQKKIIRKICGVSRMTSCRPLFKRLSILPLACLLILEMSSYIFLNKRDFITNVESHGRDTRSREQFRIPSYRLNTSRGFTSCLGLKIFNKIPADIKNESSITKFKGSLTRRLLSNTFYSVEEYLSFVF